MIKQLCPINKDRILLKPHFHATLVDDLPEEYTIRRRDSNYLCISEFDVHVIPLVIYSELCFSF